MAIDKDFLSFDLGEDVEPVKKEKAKEGGIDVNQSLEQLDVFINSNDSNDKRDSKGSQYLIKDKEGNLIFKIPIAKIDPPAFHDRTYIPDEAVERLSESFKAHGQAQPIVVRRKPNGRFERISGYLRIEAAKRIGWDKIHAFIVDVDDITALKLMIAENTHRSNLTDYDKLNTALYAINKVLGITPGEVKSFYYRMDNKKSGKIKEDITEEENKLKEEIEKVLRELNISSWNAFGVMLKLYFGLHPKVKELMQRKGLKYHIAYEINKLAKNEDLLYELVEIIENQDEITLKEVKDLISELKQKYETSQDNSEISLYNELKDKVKEVSKITGKLKRKWNKMSDKEKIKVEKEIKVMEEFIDKKIIKLKEILG